MLVHINCVCVGWWLYKNSPSDQIQFWKPHFYCFQYLPLLINRNKNCLCITAIKMETLESPLEQKHVNRCASQHLTKTQKCRRKTAAIEVSLRFCRKIKNQKSIRRQCGDPLHQTVEKCCCVFLCLCLLQPCMFHDTVLYVHANKCKAMLRLVCVYRCISMKET